MQNFQNIQRWIGSIQSKHKMALTKVFILTLIPMLLQGRTVTKKEPAKITNKHSTTVCSTLFLLNVFLRNTPDCQWLHYIRDIQELSRITTGET